ncbi:MAG: ferrochelatase [Acidimicrobiales bacterium]
MSSGPTDRTGVLVMAHGTPAGVKDIGAFYTSIRRGRPPTPELLDELRGRYEAIGGISPLAELTAAQVRGIGADLEESDPGRFVVRYGAKHTVPSIEDGVAGLVDAGVDRIVGLVLAPHQASLGSGEYLERAARAAELEPALAFVPVTSWHRARGLAELLADRTAKAMAALDAERGGREPGTAVLFTAHSLPERAVATGDPYPAQVAESAACVTGLLGLDAHPAFSWSVAWQSAGRTADPWIGPDLLTEIARLAREGATGVVVCPVGFVSDHLEILYDLDIEARKAADQAGVAFARTASLNDDPRFLHILANVVREAAASLGRPNLR